MGWSHPDISLEDLLNLIKGFVDIVVLASGYQSSGLPAVWDVQNIKKAVQWGLFFENVFRRLVSSDDFHDSLEELDAALLEIKSNPYFPQGIADLSSSTLTRARDFVLRHLVHTLPLTDTHLSAILRTAVEMDLDDLKKTENNCLSVYLNKLKLQTLSLNLLPERIGFIKDSMILPPDLVSPYADQAAYDFVSNPCDMEGSVDKGSPFAVSNIKIKEHRSDDLSEFIVQELVKRQIAVSCISSAESGLDSLCKTITCKKLIGYSSDVPDEQASHATSLLSEEQLANFAAWNKWRSRSLSYLLDKKTVRLVSGANMIFSAPKIQWTQVFQRMNVSTEAHNDDFLEIIELLLLGCVASRWSCLIEHFLSVSYDLLTIPKQYQEVHNFFQGTSQTLHYKEETEYAKENGILEYLTGLLGSQLHLLWQMVPVLPAVTIPFWSPLFRLYINELETQFKGDSSPFRCCDCVQAGKEHNDCELAERIRCLYVFHVRGSHIMVGTSSADG